MNNKNLYEEVIQNVNGKDILILKKIVVTKYDITDLLNAIYYKNVNKLKEILKNNNYSPHLEEPLYLAFKKYLQIEKAHRNTQSSFRRPALHKIREIIYTLISHGFRLNRKKKKLLNRESQIYDKLLSEFAGKQAIAKLGKTKLGSKKIMQDISKYLKFNENNNPNLFNNNPFGKGFGGTKMINIPNYGKRKVRYQKNGRAYVIVKGKKIKL